MNTINIVEVRRHAKAAGVSVEEYTFNLYRYNDDITINYDDSPIFGDDYRKKK